MRKLIIMALAAAFLAVGCNGETRTTEPLGTPRAEVERLSEREFVNMAASGHQFEVLTAELALEQPNLSPQLRQIVQRLHEDHRADGERLATLAEQEGISMPDRMVLHHQQMYDELRQLEGEQFEQQFIELQLLAHNESIDLYQQAASELENDTLRQYAARGLPGLQEHRQLIEQQRRQQFQ